MKRVFVAAFAVILLTPALLLAHNGHKHKTIMGTVKAISASHIDVTTPDGKDVDVPLAKETMFMRGDAMVGSDHVKPGTRVVIVLGEDDKTAAHVKIGVVQKK
jgi:hypothetical protein